jgi:hypothetical protein
MLGVLIGLSLVAMIIGHLWLIVLGVRTKGWSTGIWFTVVGFAALVWGYRNWRNPNDAADTRAPTIVMGGGMLLLICLVLASSV